MDVDSEIVRLREWRHETDKTLWAIGLQLKQLSQDVTSLAPEVHRLADAERIAHEVAKRLRAQSTLRLSNLQRVGAAVLGLLTAADLIQRLTGG